MDAGDEGPPDAIPMPSRHQIGSIGTSPRRGRTSSGSATSSTSRRGKGISIWRLWWTPSAGGGVGWAMEPHLRTELVLHALNMAIGQRRPQGVITPIKAASTPRSPSADVAGKPASGRQWVHGQTATTMHSARASAPHWSANYCCNTALPHGTRLNGRSSSSSRAGTTRIGAIRRSTTIRRCDTNGSRRLGLGSRARSESSRC